VMIMIDLDLSMSVGVLSGMSCNDVLISYLL
jgi:hypothetical protein